MPLLFLHHSLGNFQLWKGFGQIVGGQYVMPGFGFDSASLSDYAHDLDLEIQVLDPDHPVTKGIADFRIRDEGYSNIRLSPDIHPLFGTNHPQSAPMMGWVHQSQNSSVVYLMFGHDRHAYENESLRQIMENSIRWLSN
jgi:type 1 glutamine amidotransferase